MTAGPIVSFLVFCVSALLLMMFVFARRRRADEAGIRSLLGSPRKRLPIQTLIVATDADLKVEFLFFVYLLFVTVITALLKSPKAADEILALLVLVAAVQGFAFRQWLSSWRFRNIVHVSLLTATKSIRLRGKGAFSELAISQVVMWWLLWISPFYALFQVGGFLLHEILAEVRKRRLLLRRKLHLFDLDFISDERDRVRLIRAVYRFQLSSIREMAVRAKDAREALLLEAFELWLRNDFLGMDRLLEEKRDVVERDPRLLYYFGKALYARGEISAARELLISGWAEHNDAACRAYLVLCELAVDRTEASISALLERIKEHMPGQCGSKAEMFLSAYYALALAIFSGRSGNGPVANLRDALYHIHEAMRFNQKVYEGEDLGPLQKIYFEANNQIFIDIYGYIVFRQGNLQLSFRVLESAIVGDNTYPWPYFHIALIYERLGRVGRARSIYYRIAANEVSNSVLRQLCVVRLERLRAEG